MAEHPVTEANALSTQIDQTTSSSLEPQTRAHGSVSQQVGAEGGLPCVK